MQMETMTGSSRYIQVASCSGRALLRTEHSLSSCNYSIAQSTAGLSQLLLLLPLRSLSAHDR